MATAPIAQAKNETRPAADPYGKKGWWRWLSVLLPALVLYFVPLPGLNAAQRHLLAIFLATIVSLVAQPVPMGAAMVLAMTTLVFTRTLPASKVLSGFSNQTVWLIFSAFLFARAVTATRLGTRLAYFFVRSFGRSPLSVGYSLGAAGVVLAPFIPSDTARGGAVIYPITRSLAQVFQSEPGPTARRMGSFLMLAAFHANYTASAMFLTSMVANPLIAEIALKIAHVQITWIRWAIGSCVPGLLSLACVPYLIYRLHPPEIQNTEPARDLARGELQAMGPLSRNEKWLVAIMLAVMTGWISSPWHPIPSAFVALAGVSAILLLRVLAWDDLLSERKAWDALIWFAPLVMMADALAESGTIKVLSGALFGHMQGWAWAVALVGLVTVYLYVHYAFASMTAHVTALYPSFLAAAVVGGVPPMLASISLGYFSNLNAGLTHYGTGSAPIFFGAGYVDQATWWKVGFLVSLLNLVFWLGVGPLWWKLVGLW